jgi:hypothetical protein
LLFHMNRVLLARFTPPVKLHNAVIHPHFYRLYG